MGTPRRGLVLGAGAALGGAWALGVLTALSDVEGYDPATANVVVGTSAGSVLAALIGCGVPLPEVVARLSAQRALLAGTAPVNALDADDVAADDSLYTIPRPVMRPADLRLAARALASPRDHTLMTLAASLAPRGRGDLSPVRALVGAANAGDRWPESPRTQVVAVEAATGRRVVFGRTGAPFVPLADAVVASCSAPGFFPPLRLGSRTYVDGGAFSMTNADVLAGEHLDEVVVVAPMCMGSRDRPSSVVGRLERRLRAYANRRLGIETRVLAAAGADVRVFAPTALDLAVMGPNVMDPRRRNWVFATALTNTRAALRAASEQGA
jgi:NTE family protein